MEVLILLVIYSLVVFVRLLCDIYYLFREKHWIENAALMFVVVVEALIIIEVIALYQMFK